MNPKGKSKRCFITDCPCEAGGPCPSNETMDRGFDDSNTMLDLEEETRKVNKIITGMYDIRNETEIRQLGVGHASQRFKDLNHQARYSNDIVIAYVHELSGYAGKALPYLMHLGASGVVIRFDGLFDPYLLAHEVGHVLGAGHQEDDNGLLNSLHSFY